MSSTVRSYGFIAVLKNPVPKKDYEDLTEKMYDEKSTLDVTYDKNLAYLDYNTHRPYHEREDIYGLHIQGAEKRNDPQDLVREVAKYGLEIDESTIRAYDCIWYNGSDNPVDQLTKAKYLKQIAKLESEPSPEDWVCPDCGSDEIQVMDWVEVKTNTPVGDPEAGDYFCPECDTTFRSAEKRKDFAYPLTKKEE